MCLKLFAVTFALLWETKQKINEREKIRYVKEAGWRSGVMDQKTSNETEQNYSNWAEDEGINIPDDESSVGEVESKRLRTGLIRWCS